MILNAILDPVNINYYILGDKIILTSKGLVKPISSHFFNNQVLKKSNNINQKEYLAKDKNIIVLGKEQAVNQPFYHLKGIIKNVSNGKPISKVKIFLKNENYVTYTNSRGEYTLNIPYGYHILKATKPNFTNFTQKLIIYNDSKFNFKLFEKAESLDEVVISGKLTSNVKKVATGVTEIKAAEVKVIPLVFGERDILKIATTLPGVKTGGEGSLGYNVRGGKVDQNLILLDNATIYNPSHFFGVFSAINPFSTKSAKIYKGSLPVEFGGRLASIIDIKTKKVSTTKFKGEGNIGIITSNLLVEVPIIKDKTAVLAGYRTTYSDWVMKQIDEPSIKNSEASFMDAIVRVESDINKNNAIHTTAYYSKDRFSVSSDSIYKYQNKLLSIEWNHKFNKNTKVAIQLNNSIYDFNVIDENVTKTSFDIHFAIMENQLKLKFNNTSFKDHKITYGISSKLYNLNPGELNPIGSESVLIPEIIPKEKGLESALFVSDRYKFNEQLEVDLGFRYSLYAFLGETDQTVYKENLPMIEENSIGVNHYNNNEVVKTYSAPETRISARYSFTPDFSIKGSFNNTIQYIHLLSSNTMASPVDTWRLSNLNIEPQKSMQVSLGLFKNFDGNTYEVSLETYYKKMKNLLEYKVGADLLLNNNIEEEILPSIGKSYGVEFLVKKNKGDFNGWLSYSYSRSLVKVENMLSGDQINNGDFYSANYDKPHDLSLIMNYKLTHRYSFSLNFTYQTGRPITYPIGKYQYAGIEHVVYSDRNQFRIPDYYRLDLGVNIEGNHKIKKLAHSFWNVSVYNVLGRHNPYAIFFKNDEGRIQAYQSSIFAMPIPTVSYNFKF